MKHNSFCVSHITDKVYRSEYGYFMWRDDKQQWVFTPMEKDLNVDILMNITDTLRNFNEKNYE